MSALSLTMGIIKQKGILGLYKGTSATMLRDVSFSVCYFPLFANLNALGPKTHPGSSKTVFWWSFISGCAAGSISALFVNPADVVKTRLQLINKDAGAQSYNGILDAFTKILKQEGITAFFRGGLCRMIVIAPLVIIFNLLLTKKSLLFRSLVFGHFSTQKKSIQISKGGFLISIWIVFFCTLT